MNAPRVLAAIATLALALGLFTGAAQAQLLPGDPDLVVDEVMTDPDPQPGEDVSVQMTVEADEEGGDADAFDYSFELDGAPFGQEQTHEDGLAAGENVTLSASQQWSVEPGEHEITGMVSLEDDSNPDNNVSSTSYTIGADVTVTSFEVDPTEAIEGDTIEFTATIENVADPSNIASDTNETFQVAFPVNGQDVVNPVTVAGLAAGETETVSRTWTASQGQHSVTAVVDPNEVVADLDRSNDEAGPQSLEVEEALPDLVVSSLSFSPDPPAPDEQVTFTAGIANNGRADAGEHDVSLVVDEETVDTASVSSVAQGDETEATLSWRAEAGVHDVEVLADASEEIDESSEGNNAWTLQIPVGADLVVRSLDVQPPEPRANDRVRFSAEIANEGLDVDEPFEVSFAVDGTPVDSLEVGSLAADDVRNVTSRVWNATEGDHNVSVILDPGDEIGEIDRTNNQRHRSLTVGEPQPDLRVLAAVLDPAAPQEGEETTVRTTIANAGSRDADGFALTATMDGEEIGQTRIDGLEAGEETTVDAADWTVTNGSHQLAIQVDTDDEVEEGDEANNTLTRHVGIGTDLAALELSLSPSDPAPGEEATALVLAQNNGTTTIGPTNVSYRLDGTEIGTATLDGLGPNEQGSAEITFNATTPGTLAALLDADGAIDEFDEDNNRATRSLDVTSDAGPPDLTVTSVTIDGDPSEDDSVRFVAEVANEGEGPSPQTLVDFRIDGSSIDSPVTVPGLDAGGTAEVESSEFSPSQDEHELEVRVDPEGSVDEADETNNAFTRSVEAGAASIPLGLIPVVLAVLAATLGLRREEQG